MKIAVASPENVSTHGRAGKNELIGSFAVFFMLMRFIFTNIIKMVLENK